MRLNNIGNDTPKCPERHPDVHIEAVVQCHVLGNVSSFGPQVLAMSNIDL